MWDDILDGIGDYVSGGDWVDPLLNFGVGQYQNRNRQRGRDDLVDLYRENEQQNYDQSKKHYDEYKDYLDQYNQVAAGNAAARRSAQAAYASAARQEAKNKQRALKKGKRRHAQGFEEAIATLRPYADAGTRIMPQMEDAYNRFAKKSKMLEGYLNTPQAMAKINQPSSIWDQRVDLPEYLR